MAERLDFTPEEAVDIWEAVLEEEKRLARLRKRDAGRTAGRGQIGPGKLPEPIKGDSRDKAAEATGKSGRTLEKAKAVRDAARADPAQRKEIARLFKEIGASQRATAKMLGVDEGTVRRDLRAENSAPAAEEPAGNLVVEEPTAENSAPAEWFQNDVDPAALAQQEADRQRRSAEHLPHGDRRQNGNVFPKSPLAKRVTAVS